MVQNHRLRVMDVHEFDGVMTMLISQPTDVIEPSKSSEMVDGGIVEGGRSLDGVGCVVGC